MKLDRLIIGLVFALTGEVSQAMLAWDTSECSTDVLYCTKGTAAGTFVDEFELPELDFPNELELAAEIGSSSILIGGLENTRDQKIPAKYGVTISSLDWVDFPLGVRGFIGLTISSAAIANLTRSDISLATQSGTTGLGGQIRHVPIRAMIEREDRLVGARFVIVTLLGVFVCLLVGIGYARRRKRIKEFEKELEIERARPRAPVY